MPACIYFAPFVTGGLFSFGLLVPQHQLQVVQANVFHHNTEMLYLWARPPLCGSRRSSWRSPLKSCLSFVEGRHCFRKNLLTFEPQRSSLPLARCLAHVLVHIRSSQSELCDAQFEGHHDLACTDGASPLKVPSSMGLGQGCDPLGLARANQ